MQSLVPLHVLAPRLLVSECLQGQAVRYDGGHKYQPLLAQHLWPHARALPLCPEMLAGLGVPRPPIERRLGPTGEYLALASDGSATATALVPSCQQLARALASERLCGAILKARSPSCGAGSSPLFGANGELRAMGDGVWVQSLRAQLPALLIVDETQLQSARDCLHLLRLAQLASALTERQLSAEWRRTLRAANPLHDGPDLGLAKVAEQVGRESAALDYLTALPVRSTAD